MHLLLGASLLLVLVPLRWDGSQAPPQHSQDVGTIEFQMEGKAWTHVLEWLSDQTGLAVCMTWRPCGQCRFKSPKGAKYTLPEIIRIINLGLLEDGYLLIRSEKHFYLIGVNPEVGSRESEEGFLEALKRL